MPADPEVAGCGLNFLDTPRLRTWCDLILIPGTVFGVVLLQNDIYLHYFHVERVGED